MENQITFAGATGSITDGVEKEWDNSFEYVYFTNHTYTHDDPDAPFQYKYAIETAEVEDGVLISLSLVISPDSLSEDKKELVREAMDGYCEYYDLLAYGGFSIYFGCEHLKDVEATDEEVERYERGVMSLLPAFDFMRGFHLDKAWNQIGTTGWDVVEYATTDREELFQLRWGGR